MIDRFPVNGVYYLIYTNLYENICDEVKKMKDSYKIADAERDVMEVLWQHTEPVSTRELLDIMNEKGKNWKRQTLNTLLFRLEDKKVVARKRGYVTPALSQTELLQKQTEELLNNLYGGKFRNFCAALAGNDTISDKEAEELDNLIEKLRDRS